MFISNKAEYIEELQAAKRLVRDGITYPDFVFEREFLYLYFAEYSLVTRESVIRELSLKGGDASVTHVYLSLDLSPAWFAYSRHWGANCITVEKLSSDWTRELIEPAGSSMFYGQSPSAIFGDKGQWCVFNDQSYDLSVIGANFDVKKTTQSLVLDYVHDIEWAVEYWKNCKSVMGDDFYSAIRANYSR